MSEANLIPAGRIERRILLLRGQKVMLDFELAELYGVETRTLNQAVQRNKERFPEDFMFQLSDQEVATVLKSQIVISNAETPEIPKQKPRNLKSQFVISSLGHGGRRKPYFAFTEQGVAMLSSVLRSPRAVLVNIAIMRTFVQLRQMLASSAEMSGKLAALEAKYDKQFKVVFDAIRELMSDKEASKPKREIGFHTAMPRSGKVNGRVKARKS
ncbi:MAG TPA: ORF6N domain-containing protein [Verrucomicrobiae bacterium]|nr:ORF6N domain-containing protein [Verrucomicrobiae bacterium]